MLTGLFVLLRLFHRLYYLDSVSQLPIPHPVPFSKLVQELISFYSSIEGDAIVITACVPGLRPFVKNLRQKFNPSQLPNAILLPKKSNRNSEITVPASSISLARTDEQCPAPINHSQQVTTTQEATPKAKKEEVLEPIPPTPEDLERQAFKQWRRSEDTRWRSEEAKTSLASCSSKLGEQYDAP